MYENEAIFPGDDQNLIPLKKGILKYREHSWFSPPDDANVTVRLTTTDTEALIMPVRQNVNASGIKRGTKMGLGDSQDPYR